ncbi:MAG: hypothetical protein HY287_05735 [Planctomycetes bacterium]|nr:hypothetical protein [Planctomycetota bacterium]
MQASKWLCATAACVAFTVSGAAWGQSCGPGTPGVVSCDPGLEHGNGGTAACQNRCVGDTLDCTATFRYLDQLLDPVLVKAAFNTVHGNVRDPAVGNLPIISIVGNAVCTDSGGACNPATGANCAFPCLVGPGGKGCSDAGTSLSLPGAPQNGSVRVADRNMYTILVTDIGSLPNTFSFTQRDLCDSACSDCPANDDSATASASSLVPNCNDSNACTTDTCSSASGSAVCANTPNPPCNDNNACTTDTCSDDDNECTTDICNPELGCVFTPNPPCNDQNACTTDTCDPAIGCVFTPNPPCEDNNACTTDTCNPAEGCVFTPNPPCNDQNACTTDTCDPAIGCVFTPNPPCNDQNACTTDTCDPAIGCVFTPNPPCEDNNACTTDTCNPAIGCVFTPNPPCNDNSACTTDTCDPAIGCVFTPNPPCEDDNACTTDICNPELGCVFTPNPPCNDHNACTTDTCNPAIGCVFTPNPPCEDDNACTTDTCDPAIGCVFTPNPPCNDHNACTTDTCDPATGCVYTPLPPCDDHNVCTADSCNPDIGCVFTPNPPCDDHDACTDDSCDAQLGCVFEDNGSCHAETCRTPGFWDTHACGTDGVHCEKSNSSNLTQKALNECGGCVNICGDVINNTLLNNSDSALESMCVAVTGAQRLQLVRQLTAAALNCCVSGKGGACTGASIDAVFNACNAACAAGGTTTHINGQVVDCVGALDAFNNGLLSDCHDRILGVCGDGSICTEQVPCAHGPCGAPGPAGSSNACNSAISNKCYVVGTSTCATGGANGPQVCP